MHFAMQGPAKAIFEQGMLPSSIHGKGSIYGAIGEYIRCQYTKIHFARL